MTKEEKLRRRHQENLLRLKNFCLMDDDFMTVCFENNRECVELVLRIIMEEPDLNVLDVKTQHFMKNLLKRSLRLDIFATNSQGRMFNIEIQREDKGAGMKRARYHSSMIDSRVLDPGELFEKLPETYVIFITEHDIFGEGRPLYHVERCVLEAERQFGDEAHIIYVNGAYRGDNPLGRLMADFHCTEASEMYYNELRNQVKYFKETKEGAVAMSRAMEEAIKREREDAKAEVIVAMFEKGISTEKIAEIVGMTVEGATKLIKEYTD